MILKKTFSREGRRRVKGSHKDFMSKMLNPISFHGIKFYLMFLVSVILHASGVWTVETYLLVQYEPRQHILRSLHPRKLNYNTNSFLVSNKRKSKEARTLPKKWEKAKSPNTSKIYTHLQDDIYSGN